MNALSKNLIEELRTAIATLPPLELPTKHWFADGMYCREMSWPAGGIILGAVHKTEHLFILIKGIASFTTPEGIRRKHAPCVVVGVPGIQRVGLALTDCVVLNIHRTDKTDLAEIEAELVEIDPNSMYGLGNELKLKELSWPLP